MAAETIANRSRSRWTRLGLGLLVVFIFAAAVAYGLHAHRTGFDAAAQEALAGESGAQTKVYRRSLLGGDDIVFDVEQAGGEMSAVAMTRRLLKVAEALKNENFGKVYLASRGAEKFYLDGRYFRQLGEERGWQNPIYTIRTIPQNVYRLDGTPAFGSWSGGLIGVVGKQMEDNNEFHRNWWIEDALSTLN